MYTFYASFLQCLHIQKTVENCHLWLSKGHIGFSDTHGAPGGAGGATRGGGAPVSGARDQYVLRFN